MELETENSPLLDKSLKLTLARTWAEAGGGVVKREHQQMFLTSHLQIL